MESDEQSDGQSYQLDLTPMEDDVSPVVIEKESPKLRMPSFSICTVLFVGKIQNVPRGHRNCTVP